jgi:hypothetical protein
MRQVREEDYLILKLDIEGVEHQLLRTLLAAGGARLVRRRAQGGHFHLKLGSAKTARKASSSLTRVRWICCCGSATLEGRAGAGS